MGEVAVEEKIRIFAGQVYAAAGVGMWCFSKRRSLFLFYMPQSAGAPCIFGAERLLGLYF